ncbi:MAG: hypothetical protein RR549_05990 [Oscillospiraceae bacterium]
MAIICSQIKIDAEHLCNKAHAEKIAIENAIKKYSIDKNKIIKQKIYKQSIDARHKQAIKVVYSIYFELDKETEDYLCEKNKEVTRKNTTSKIKFDFGNEKMQYKPLIIGFGPAGIFASYILALNGYEPIVFERGEEVEQRLKSINNYFKGENLNENSNVQFGEGGAGTFSDGKLTTRVNDPLCETVLKIFNENGAPDEILHKAKPHIGTDILRSVIKNIRKQIIKMGGSIYFNSHLKDIIFKNDIIEKIILDNQEVPCDVLILATGHSARDVFHLLHEKNVALESKAFSVGFRIEHLQNDINNAMYGRSFTEKSILPPAEYQHSFRKNGRGVYTFCMCPGGYVVPSASEKDTIVTNGMSEFARNGKNSNSALVVGVSPEDFGNDILAGVEFQRKIEKNAFILTNKTGKAPATTAKEFLNCSGLEKSNKNIIATYEKGIEKANIKTLFPPIINEYLELGLKMFETKQNGFISKENLITAPETRTSSPIRILRKENGESLNLGGLYPCGEGAGYAGGIMSAAVDGIKIAIKIMEKYRK